jgi:hypothetical protein
MGMKFAHRMHRCCTDWRYVDDLVIMGGVDALVTQDYETTD